MHRLRDQRHRSAGDDLKRGAEVGVFVAHGAGETFDFGTQVALERGRMQVIGTVRVRNCHDDMVTPMPGTTSRRVDRRNQRVSQVNRRNRGLCGRRKGWLVLSAFVAVVFGRAIRLREDRESLLPLDGAPMRKPMTLRPGPFVHKEMEVAAVMLPRWPVRASRAVALGSDAVLVRCCSRGLPASCGAAGRRSRRPRHSAGAGCSRTPRGNRTARVNGQ